MNLLKPAFVFASTLLTSTAFAEFQLPHTPSESLTTEQVNENMQALANATTELQSELSALQTVKSTPVLMRMTASENEVTLLTYGSISVKAVCSFLNGSDASQGRGLVLWTETSVAGSLIASSGYNGYYGGEGNNAHQVWLTETTNSATDDDWDNKIDQGLTVSATGDVIIMDGESFGYGLNVQGTDCLIAGNIIAFSGEAAPEEFEIIMPPINEPK